MAAVVVAVAAVADVVDVEAHCNGLFNSQKFRNWSPP